MRSKDFEVYLKYNCHKITNQSEHFAKLYRLMKTMNN
jgi:hypothetical protein